MIGTETIIGSLRGFSKSRILSREGYTSLQDFIARKHNDSSNQDQDHISHEEPTGDYQIILLNDDNANVMDNEEESNAIFSIFSPKTIILMALLLGTLLCAVPISYLYRRWKNQQIFNAYMESQRRIAAARRTPIPSKRKISDPPEKRYKDIETWLVSKRVTSHDDVCEALAKQGDKKEVDLSKEDTTPIDAVDKTEVKCSVECCPKEDIRSHLSVDTVDLDESCSSNESKNQVVNVSIVSGGNNADTASPVIQSHAAECSICCDAFKPNDIVSWSSNFKCSHVFHHQCIKEWLLENDSCPWCRKMFLPIDEKSDEEAGVIRKDLKDVQAVASRCFYCLDHGTVHLPANISVPCNISETSIVQRCAEVPAMETLQALRGSLVDDATSEVVTSDEEENEKTDEELGNSDEPPLQAVDNQDADYETTNGKEVDLQAVVRGEAEEELANLRKLIFDDVATFDQAEDSVRTVEIVFEDMSKEEFDEEIDENDTDTEEEVFGRLPIKNSDTEMASDAITSRYQYSKTQQVRRVES